MPEAIILCCDCSEWMRNGDFPPNRFDAQKDAVGVISQNKIDQHPENTVGIIAMGKDHKAEVLVNCSRDTGRVLVSAHKMRIEGNADILVAIQTAQLALKHRKNKKQTQRIILFVGSPVKVSVKLLVKAGKKLKKNNVAVDIVNMGEEEHNTPILEEFLRAVKSTDNSHLITVPSGTQQLLSDTLLSSPIFSQQGGMNDLGLPDNGAGAGIPGDDGAGGAGAGAAAFGGIDPNMDPEMAMAIRQSLEEERARQEALTRENANNQGANADAANPGAANVAANANASLDENENVGDEEAAAAGDGHDGQEHEEMDIADAELLQALAMSMQAGAEENAEATGSAAAGSGNEASTDALDDDTYMNELLSGLPGVDKSELDIKELLGDKQNEPAEDEDGDASMEDKEKKDKDNKPDKKET